MPLMQVDISPRDVLHALEGQFGEVTFTGKPYLQNFITMPYADLHASTPDVIVCLDGNMQHRQYASVVGDLVLYPDEFSIFVPDSILEGSRQHVLDH